ncbi:unnamed protein product [marine sediment metagenome]|uniref:Uncharacterized protein n=1 Tax=marine sediment metagenome TaxID=412755 RepID=X1THT1_9ZZZZ
MDIKKGLKTLVDKFLKEEKVDTAAVERAKRQQEAMKQAAKTLPK